jgi:hypothetical protein
MQVARDHTKMNRVTAEVVGKCWMGEEMIPTSGADSRSYGMHLHEGTNGDMIAISKDLLVELLSVLCTS